MLGPGPAHPAQLTLTVLGTAATLRYLPPINVVARSVQVCEQPRPRHHQTTGPPDSGTVRARHGAEVVVVLEALHSPHQ